MSKDKCPPRAACVCIGVCVCNVCALKRKRFTKDKADRESPHTWSPCCRGDKQFKRDVLAEAGPIVCGLKKELFDWLSRKSGSVLQL